ncbi:uncharacterized protein BXZ73DRAFT_95888 [Epithele typhae]|uniref:uncharacterized protein n=1 Tax=Epithele typhae TaxID=378194 RepID=UPI0020078C70|nr:uncharacterized protein BXZ73DRAFT_95888 [Epithele typhae]KAH9946388.1 hypothetical protein BXZ73DRAFT_95888 [Epithele typhae]
MSDEHGGLAASHPEPPSTPPSPTTTIQPSMTIHTDFMSSMPPMTMYPVSSGTSSRAAPPKRKQVKNACTNCQKACKKCYDARPCLRCVKYGLADECVDSLRKERAKGKKRGPYKKRDDKTANVRQQQADVVVQQAGASPLAVPATVPHPTAQVPYAAPVFTQYPPSAARPGDPPLYFSPVVYTVPAVPPPAGQDGEPIGAYPPHPGFFPTAFIPITSQYGTYMVPHPYVQHHPHMRPDMQIPVVAHPMPHPFPGYPQAYMQPPVRSPGAEAGTPREMVDSRSHPRPEHEADASGK